MQALCISRLRQLATDGTSFVTPCVSRSDVSADCLGKIGSAGGRVGLMLPDGAARRGDSLEMDLLQGEEAEVHDRPPVGERLLRRPVRRGPALEGPRSQEEVLKEARDRQGAAGSTMKITGKLVRRNGKWSLSGAFAVSATTGCPRGTGTPRYKTRR